MMLTLLIAHDLRRSLGSWMVNTGASLVVIGGALGHIDSKSTEVLPAWQSTQLRMQWNALRRPFLG